MVLFLIKSATLLAQEPKLVLDKPGNFEMINWGIYSNCIDCKITKAEETANYAQLKELAEQFKKNPVLQDIKGFTSKVVLFHEYYGNKSDQYGIPGKMSIQFCYYFLAQNNTVATATIEPPDFDILINQLWTPMCDNMGFRGSNAVTDFTNPKYDKKKKDLAAEKTHVFFFTPGKKENLAPGIDRYADETVIIYDDSRPDYWIPATVKEIFESWIEFYEYEPDLFTSEFTVNILKDQYSKFSEEERNMPAYFGARGDMPLLTVDTKVSEKQLMKANPLYWDKNRPRTDIQFLVFNLLKDQKRYEREAEEALKNQGGGYHKIRFMAALDLELLNNIQKLILKK